MSGPPAAPPRDLPTRTEITPQQQNAMVQAALRGAMPRFYANSIVVAQSPVDVALVMFANGGPVGTVNIAYPTAKQLIDDLQKALALIEAAIGEKIRPIRSIDEALKAEIDNPNAQHS
jgi:hypothetical protein